MGYVEDMKHEDWGLSLSLKPPITLHNHDHKSIICKREPLFSTDKRNPKLQKVNSKGVEVTDLPLVVDLEEVEIPKLSSPSPNSTLTSTTACKRLFGNLNGEREDLMMSDDQEEVEGGSMGGGGGGGGGERKKLRLSKEQITVLEQAFREHSTLNTKQKLGLSRQVKLSPRQVEVWFQNRRARTKLKQTEVECEYLKKFCESLREENKKLQREVQGLRALKLLSPHHDHDSMIHANSHASATLTMCPSCKSLSSSSSITKDTRINVFRGPRLVPQNMKLSTSAITTTQYRSH